MRFTTWLWTAVFLFLFLAALGGFFYYYAGWRDSAGRKRVIDSMLDGQESGFVPEFSPLERRRVLDSMSAGSAGGQSAGGKPLSEKDRQKVIESMSAGR